MVASHNHNVKLGACMAGLTPAGVLHSWFLGTSVYAAFGWGAYILVCLYFLLGSAVRLPHIGPAVHACLSPCSCTQRLASGWCRVTAVHLCGNCAACQPVQ